MSDVVSDRHCYPMIGPHVHMGPIKTGGYLVFIQRGKGNILEWKVVSELRMVFFRHLLFVATASKSDWICYMQVGFDC